MADFSIIADVSGALVRLLRKNLCPEPVQSPESIQLASPSDKNGDFQVGVFLYDIREVSEYRGSATIRRPDDRVRFPPRPLNLYYLIFLNSKSQIAAGAEMEQRILGRVTQALMDRAFVDVVDAHPFSEEPEEDAGITLLNLNFEDKSKIWGALSQPYRLGVYFSLSPVLLSSRREETITRVVSAEFQTQQLRRGRRIPPKGPSTRESGGGGPE